MKISQLTNVMKTITKSNDNRFDYNEILSYKKPSIEYIRKFAIKSNTPYVRFDKVYHTKYGAISKSVLYEVEK